LKPKYASKLYFETTKIDADSVEGKSSDEGESATNGSTTKTGNNGLTQPRRAKRKIEVLRVLKLNPAEQAARDEEKKRTELELIAKTVGFSKVIRKISQSVSNLNNSENVIMHIS
jgi:hypothetical protein